jgi:hypothetical protein
MLFITFQLKERCEQVAKHLCVTSGTNSRSRSRLSFTAALVVFDRLLCDNFDAENQFKKKNNNKDLHS